jgi:aminodeoxyfutalosine deaminase
MSFPKVELHVHLEGTVRPETLLEIAHRNDYPLSANTVEEVAKLYDYRDFAHFIAVWILTTNALRTRDDFRQVVVAYAAEAAEHGAVYLEGIFSPGERVRRGVSWEDIFGGYCDGAEEGRELHGVEIRLTPDIYRGATSDEAEQVLEYSVKYRDRGVVGVGLGGLEAEYPPEAYAPVFDRVRAEGLGSVPHAGEVAGPASVRARSMLSVLPGSDMGSARWTTPTCSSSCVSAGSCSMSVPSRTCAPARFRRSRSTRFPGCWRPECRARSRWTIRRCSTPT